MPLTRSRWVMMPNPSFTRQQFSDWRKLRRRPGLHSCHHRQRISHHKHDYRVRNISPARQSCSVSSEVVNIIVNTLLHNVLSLFAWVGKCKAHLSKEMLLKWRDLAAREARRTLRCRHNGLSRCFSVMSRLNLCFRPNPAVDRPIRRS